MTYLDQYPDCKGCPIKEFCEQDYVNSAYACETLQDYEEYPLWEQIFEREIQGEWDN